MYKESCACILRRNGCPIVRTIHVMKWKPGYSNHCSASVGTIPKIEYQIKHSLDHVCCHFVLFSSLISIAKERLCKQKE